MYFLEKELELYMELSIIGNGAFANEIYTWIISNHTNIPPTSNIKFININDTIQKDDNLIIAIGNAEKRKSLYHQYSNYNFINIIHKTSILYSPINATGVIIGPNVIVSTNAVIHNNVAINAASIIGHDNVINSHCQLNVNCNLAGYVQVGTASTINSGAIITPKVVIGDNVTVGAGAVVLNNVDNDCVVFGNPARKMLVKN